MLYGTSGQNVGVRPDTLPTPTVQKKEQDVQMSPTSTRTHTHIRTHKRISTVWFQRACWSCMYFHLKPLFTSFKIVGHLLCSSRFTGRSRLFPLSFSFSFIFFYQDPLLQPPMSLPVETLSDFFFLLSLKLLARQMLAHSRGRQRKVFHPLSWTTAECCDSCFGILNRSQSSVSHLGPAVFPQWSSVLVFSCWGSSPPKKQGELFKLWNNYMVVCVHYTVYLSIVIYEDLSTTKIIFMTSP